MFHLVLFLWFIRCLGINEFEGLSIGGFLVVQFLVIFQLVTSDLGHLTELIR